jgi:hypothetical protein
MKVVTAQACLVGRFRPGMCDFAGSSLHFCATNSNAACWIQSCPRSSSTLGAPGRVQGGMPQVGEELSE